MPEFMDVHTSMVGVTADQLHAAHQADLDTQAEENVDFKQPWADPITGHILPQRGPRRRSGTSDPRASWAPGRRGPRDHGHRLRAARGRFFSAGFARPVH